jgi:proteic killer suppression protein
MEIITRITRTRVFDKQLVKIPDYIRKKVIFWIYLVESLGLAEVMKQPGYHDEPLLGNRKGQRSVRLNRSYRLIYRMINEQLHIELLEIHNHDY